MTHEEALLYIVRCAYVRANDQQAQPTHKYVVDTAS